MRLPARLAHRATTFFVFLAVACGSPTKPDPQPGNCGLGPISASPGQTPCEPITPQCPRVRPASAQTIITAATCGFGANDTPCTAIPIPGCPLTRNVILEFILENPDNPTCTALVDVAVDPTPEGGASVHWGVQEREAAPGGGCPFAGAPYEGTASVEGPCCENVVDIPITKARRTFRLVVRTDWQ